MRKFKPSLKQDLVVISILLVVSSIAVLVIYIPVITAELGLIDDHEYFLFLGQNDFLSISNFWQTLLGKTEVGNWGSSSRFRPAYYTLRIFETISWGLDPQPRYLLRLVVLSLSATSLGSIFWVYTSRSSPSKLFKFVALSGAVLVSVSLITIPSLADVITRLGPAEFYVLAGITLFALGIARIWINYISTLGWSLALLGFLVASGSKENLVSLLPILFSMYLIRNQNKSKNFIGIFALSLATIFSIFVISGVAISSFFASKGDVYGETRTIRGFVFHLFNNQYLLWAVASLITSVLLAIVSLYISNSKETPSGKYIRKYLMTNSGGFWVSLWLIWLILAEVFTYENAYMFGRYGFITDFSVLVAWSLLFVCALYIYQYDKGFKFLTVIICLIVIALGVVPQLLSAQKIREAAELTLSTTIDVHNKLDQLLVEAKLNPSSQIYYSSNISDEVSYALLVFLEHNNLIFSSSEEFALNEGIPERIVGLKEHSAPHLICIVRSDTTYLPEECDREINLDFSISSFTPR